MTDDTGSALTLDENSDLYLAGLSSGSWGNPARAFTPGSTGTETDAFSAILNADGSLAWHAFLGSSAQDESAGIAVDTLGNIYLTGISEASWGNPLEAHHGSDDVFVVKLSPSQVPVAESGDNITVAKGQMVQLDASASYDPDDDALTYEWAQSSGVPQLARISYNNLRTITRLSKRLRLRLEFSHNLIIR